MSVSKNADGTTTASLAGQMTVPKGVATAFATIDNRTFRCSLVSHLKDGDVLAAMVSNGIAISMNREAGYPAMAMIKAADGEHRVLMPGIIKFKIDVKAGVVLHLDGFDIEAKSAIKAGDSIPVLYINGPVILSTEVARGTTKNGGQPTPLVSVFRADSKNRDATIGTWRNELGLGGNDVSDTDVDIPWVLLHDDAAQLRALFNSHPRLVSSKEKSSGWTPLHYAARWGEKDVAELLLASGANVNAKDDDGATPLHMAELIGHRDIVALLLSHGSEFTFHDAAAGGELEKMNAMLKKNPGLAFAKDSRGNTPLHDAADGDSTVAAELLLAGGAQVDARNNLGQTPLHQAASGNRGPKDVMDVTKLLLAHGAEVNAKDNQGQTPLYYAVPSGYQDEVILLLDHGADVNVKNNKGETPVQVAASGRHPEMADLLRRRARRE